MDETALHSAGALGLAPELLARYTGLLLREARAAASLAAQEDAHLQLVLLHADTAGAMARAYERPGVDDALARSATRALLRAVVRCECSSQERFRTCIALRIESEMTGYDPRDVSPPAAALCDKVRGHTGIGSGSTSPPGSRRELREVRRFLDADRPYERVAELLTTSQEVVSIIMRQERTQALLVDWRAALA